MRVLIYTNILFSALLFPKSVPAAALNRALDEHEVVLCDRNISELRNILQRKAPQYLPYELIPAMYHSENLMRDAKDQPILNAAVVFGVDIILTGDKDFLSLDIEHPKCITAAEFLRS